MIRRVATVLIVLLLMHVVTPALEVAWLSDVDVPLLMLIGLLAWALFASALALRVVRPRDSEPNKEPR
ncbi:hypothetical protein [Actinomadura sp. HBU206391]|uniref:hypothetical protein n=1 Tax=Actinomadura sp. HBU206391 TaxID=2731692 RepID=UPI00164FB2F0|nr:hypothetical protein [Actinomadura sp. HBU206391]MBC6458449.1 hypothetical protein [Actinomadura sp. HBU206391]